MEPTSTLEINVVSASELPETNLVSKMVAYVVVSLSGDSSRKFKTNADSSGGINPNWNFPMKFRIDELASTQNNRETLVFTIRCFRTLGDRDVGEVHVPVAELLQSTGNRNSMQHVTYPVRKPSGKTHGLLNFQYKFSGKVVAATASFHDQKPPAAYVTRGIGFPPPQPTAGYSPPPYNTAYAPPPAQPYGYPHYGYPAAAPPPPPPHYGYHPLPTAEVVEKKDKKSGMGKILAVGAAILGGLVCGVMLGECAADLGPPPSSGGYPAGSSGSGSIQSIAASQEAIGKIG